VIEVKVDRLFFWKESYVMMLKGVEDERALPIFIGEAEAQAIAIQMKGLKIPRPLTHDLLRSVLDEVGWSLEYVEVCDVLDRTFFARMKLDRLGDEKIIDARPSDAVALALRCDAPVYVSDKVMTDAGQVFVVNEEEVGEDVLSPPVGDDGVELTQDDVLRKEMAMAISEERYEDAARFRDEINALKEVTPEIQ